MSFKYRYVPVWPAMFTGLRHHVEAWVHKADGSTVDEGSTVELHPGDHIESESPITGGGDSTDTHPFLEVVDSIPTPPAAPAEATTAAPQVAVDASTEPAPTIPPADDADHQES